MMEKKTKNWWDKTASRNTATKMVIRVERES